MHCHLRRPAPPAVLGFNHKPTRSVILPRTNFNKVEQAAAELVIIRGDIVASSS